MAKFLSKLAFSLLFCSVIFFSGATKAREMRVVSMVLGEGLQQEDGSGFYGALSSDLLAKISIKSSAKVYPLKRALDVFFSKEADCIWALDEWILKELGHRDGTLIESENVIRATQWIFVSTKNSEIRSWSDLKDKRVGVLNGSNIGHKLETVATDVQYLSNAETKMRMLLNDRIDAVIDWFPDVYVTLIKLGLPMDAIKPLFPIDQAGVKFVCHPSEETENLIEQVNEALKTYPASKDYKTIFRKFGIPYG